MTMKDLRDQVSNLFKLTAGLFLWLAPLSLFIVAFAAPVFFYKLSFEQFLSFVNVLVWPVSMLTTLFFFKKVVTYLFFSMNQFNFFGAKGELKNVTNVIREQVDKKFEEEKEEKTRQSELDTLNNKIRAKEEEVGNATGNINNILELAKEIMKKLTAANHTIEKLSKENSNLRQSTKESNLNHRFVSSDTVNNESVFAKQTSDPVFEDEVIDK